MNPLPETTEATDPLPRLRRRIRYLRLAGICVGVFVLGMVFILCWNPWLSESERRMLGVWTWQESPGEIMFHFRDDGTMRYADRPRDINPSFMRWKIENDILSIEFSERNTLEYVAKNVLFRRKWQPDQSPLTHNADGSIAFKISDGKERVLIPWSSDQGEFLKKVE